MLTSCRCRVAKSPRFEREHQPKELVARLVQGKPVIWGVLWLQHRLVALAIANQLQAGFDSKAFVDAG